MSNQRPAVGRIVWHDLMTTDPKASVAFLTELFGWKTKEVDMGPMGKYTMFAVGDKEIGGVMLLDKSHGAPSHWIAYITVEDVDATAGRIPELGGKVGVPPMEMPDIGRWAVVLDPHGGVTSPMKPARTAPEDTGMPATGTFCWEELMSPDPEASAKFYSEIYGWKVTAMEMGSVGTYRILHRGDAMTGGIMKTPGGPPTALWVPYVAVDDVDALAGRVEGLGGKICAPPSDIPGQGRFAMVTDPAGAFIALFRGAGG